MKEAGRGNTREAGDSTGREMKDGRASEDETWKLGHEKASSRPTTSGLAGGGVARGVNLQRRVVLLAVPSVVEARDGQQRVKKLAWMLLVRAAWESLPKCPPSPATSPNFTLGPTSALHLCFIPLPHPSRHPPDPAAIPVSAAFASLLACL